jgi:4-amino-4-deoxy-L-arabinose transferase-like glycosyltransferase
VTENTAIAERGHELATAKPHVATKPSSWRRRFVFLSLMIVASVGVRAIAWGWWQTGAIESEGAEYARVAENLRNAQGYVGISTPGTELMFPPLFPVLIAGASYVTHNYELAGRLVSFFFGALLPLPVFGVASELFERRTAILAAVLAMLHPLFVNLSITVFSEGIYATLLLSAVYLALRAFERPSIKRWSIVGGAFGIAFLLRQEAVLPMAFAVLLGLFARDVAQIAKVKRSAAAIAVFAILASPQVLLLYGATGRLLLEGKSRVNFAVGIRTLAGAKDSRTAKQFEDAVNKALFSISDSPEGAGVAMRSNADVIRDTRIGVGDLVRLFTEAARRNTPTLIDQFSAKWLGAPFLPALALLGAIRRPWRPSTVVRHVFFIVVPASAVMATFTVVHAIYPRYYFILVPFLVIWGANGLVAIARWANASIASVFQQMRPRVPGVVVALLIVIATLSYALKGTRSLFLFREGSVDTLAIKDAGEWIMRQQSARVRIMDVMDTLAFHADADYVHFPYSSADSALKFFDRTKID